MIPLLNHNNNKTITERNRKYKTKKKIILIKIYKKKMRVMIMIKNLKSSLMKIFYNNNRKVKLEKENPKVWKTI